VRALLAGLVAAALLVAPAASAKVFHPGDVRLCNAKRCVPIRNRTVLDKLSSFFYGSYALTAVSAPARGAPYYELQLRNGYVTGLVATRQLDHFLSHGVNTGRFAGGRWYGVPPRISAELRRLAAGLRPRHLARPALARQ
jgi:hypothetical protein